MTIKESVLQHIEVMEKAGIGISQAELSHVELQEFGPLEFTLLETKRGRKGKPYSIYHTEQGQVGWWPLANNGPRLGWFKKAEL